MLRCITFTILELSSTNLRSGCQFGRCKNLEMSLRSTLIRARDLSNRVTEVSTLICFPKGCLISDFQTSLALVTKDLSQQSQRLGRQYLAFYHRDLILSFKPGSQEVTLLEEITTPLLTPGSQQSCFPCASSSPSHYLAAATGCALFGRLTREGPVNFPIKPIATRTSTRLLTRALRLLARLLQLRMRTLLRQTGLRPQRETARNETTSFGRCRIL